MALIRITVLAATLALLSLGLAVAQTSPPQRQTEQNENPVHLDLSVEIAARTVQGLPAALRITLKNVGVMAADLPMPSIGCGNEDGSLEIKLKWSSDDPENHAGFGGGCGSATSDRLPLVERASKEWIRLQPGEFLTFTESLRPHIADFPPGSVNYYVVYTPPRLTASDKTELKRNGFSFPTESLNTEEETFRIR